MYYTLSQALVEVGKAVGYVIKFIKILSEAQALGFPLRTCARGLVKFTNISKIC